MWGRRRTSMDSLELHKAGGLVPQRGVTAHGGPTGPLQFDRLEAILGRQYLHAALLLGGTQRLFLKKNPSVPFPKGAKDLYSLRFCVLNLNPRDALRALIWSVSGRMFARRFNGHHALLNASAEDSRVAVEEVDVAVAGAAAVVAAAGRVSALIVVSVVDAAARLAAFSHHSPADLQSAGDPVPAFAEAWPVPGPAWRSAFPAAAGISCQD
jgi:hypothetical protein